MPICISRSIYAAVSMTTLLVAGACSGGREAPEGYGVGTPGGPTDPTDPGQDDPAEHDEVPGVPPISGGTLLVSADAERAFVADPDRDRIVVVDLIDRSVVETIALKAGSEPGRATEDAAGRVHVLLRGSGEVVTLDRDGKVTDTRDVCPGPRGIDVDPATEELVVACVTGDLLRMAAEEGGAVSLRVRLAPDLRDVVVLGERTYVSRFRSGEIIALDPSGDIIEERSLPAADPTMVPSVAWRMTEIGSRGFYVAHQRASTVEIDVGEGADPNAYSSTRIVDAGGASFGELFEYQGDATPYGIVLPVDAAVNDGLGIVATVGAGSDILHLSSGRDYYVKGEPVAVRFAGENVVVQTRQPSELRVFALTGDEYSVDLGGADVTDVGHAAFHRSTKGPTVTISCASCHPEGRDDGHTWNFAPLGPRRTQTLLGDVTETMPFHWDGDIASFGELVDEVFDKRMGAGKLNKKEKAAFQSWLKSLDDLPAASKSAEISDGPRVFKKAGCDSCHNGDRFTNDGAANVGTGRAFQVPSLIGVRYRAPFMHDGCAPTLRDRFGECGGDSHGDVSTLTDSEMETLVEYIDSL